MRHQFEITGLKAANRRAVVNPLMAEANRPPAHEWRKVVKRLWVFPQRDYQYVAQELVIKYAKNFAWEHIALFQFMVTNKSWWDTVDFIATHLIGNYLKSFPEQIPATIDKCLASGNIWLQRSALLFQLKYKAATESFIPRSKVASFQYDYASVNPTSSDSASAATSNGKVSFRTATGVYSTKWRLAMGAGASWRLADLPSGVSASYEDHLRKLNWGYQYHLDVSRFLSPAMGIGLKYALFRSSNSDEVTLTTADGQQVRGIIDETVSVHLIGGFWTVRNASMNGDNAFLIKVGGGYQFLRDELEASIHLVAKGNTWALFVDLGYDLAITPWLSLGIQASFIAGDLKSLKVSGENIRQTLELLKGEKVSLNRLELSGGLRFNL